MEDAEILIVEKSPCPRPDGYTGGNFYKYCYDNCYNSDFWVGIIVAIVIFIIIAIIAALTQDSCPRISIGADIIIRLIIIALIVLFIVIIIELLFAGIGWCISADKICDN